MYNHPSLEELVGAAKSFIDETAAPQLDGHAAFHARVASNVLALVMRELAARPAAEATERDRLIELLKADADLDVEALNKTLSERIRVGALDETHPDLLNHLKTTAIAQLKIDQPKYLKSKA